MIALAFADPVSDRADALEEAAIGLYDEGKLAAAETLYLQALALREQVDDPNALAYVLTVLGLMVAEQGRLDEAVAHYERSLALPTTEPIARAATLNNLAFVHLARGDERRATDTLETAAAAFAEAGDLANAAVGHNNLGMLAQRAGRWRQARDQFAAAVEASQEADAATSDTACMLQNLAVVQSQLGQYREARSSYESALALLAGVHDPDSPTIAWVQRNLASVLLTQQQPEQALALAEAALEVLLASELADTRPAEADQAVDVFEHHLGTGHPSVALMVEHRALVALDRGELDAARADLTRALTLRLQAARLVDHLSQDEAQRWLEPIRKTLTHWLGAHPDAHDRAWRHVLQLKGLLLRQQLAQRRLARSTPEVAELMAKLDAVRRVLVLTSTAGASLASLQEEEAHLERQLASLSASYQGELQELAVGPDQVCEALGTDEALVEWFAAPSDTGALHQAFVARRGASGCTVSRVGVAVPDVDARVARWRERMGDPDALSARIDLAGAELADAIWTPLLPALDGVSRVWWVPDGTLTLVAPAALPMDGGYVVEHFEVGVLEQSQDLVHGYAAAGDGALLVGDPDFGALQEHEDPCLGAWLPLPGTRSEVEEVSSLARRSRRLRRQSVQTLTGTAASVDAVRRAVAGTRLVHLATHGFFRDP